LVFELPGPALFPSTLTPQKKPAGRLNRHPAGRLK
jgi:hypothetical protein